MMELQREDTIVKRDHASDILERDSFSIIVDGEIVATVSHDAAREFWLNRVTLDELIQSNK